MQLFQRRRRDIFVEPNKKDFQAPSGAASCSVGLGPTKTGADTAPLQWNMPPRRAWLVSVWFLQKRGRELRMEASTVGAKSL